MGGLVGRFVTIQTAIAFKVGTVNFNLQKNLLDKLMPGLIPIVVTLVVLRMLKKGVSPIKLMGILILGGAVLGAIGVL